MKKKTALGILCLAISFLMLFVLTLPTLGGQNVVFPSTYKDTPVTIKGTYWQGNGDYAVLICPGYSCDRQKWRPMADVLVSQGFSVLAFDYSGQGASSGTIGFDNAKTDAIPVQIDAALELLHRLSGVPYENIILLGHSMGGRAVLRLLYDYNEPQAVTTVTSKPVGSAILFSPEVNYHHNAQASLFAGTNDETEEPWSSLADTSIAGTDVYLYGSTADDIVADEDVLSIYRHLGGTNAPESGKAAAECVNAAGSRLTVGITSGVLHSYIMYSPKFTAYLNDALSQITGEPASYAPAKISLVYCGWLMGILGLFLTLSGLNTKKHQEDTVPELLDVKQFLLHKCLMWIPGISVAFLLCCLTVVMPFGSPVMNTPYMCFIAGYGMVMCFAYRKGAFRGTRGNLPKLSFLVKKENLPSCILVTVGLCFYLWFVLRTSMYRLIPMNYRLFWVMFATVIMTIGYYVSGCESDMLKASGTGVKLLYNLIQFVPLFLLVGFYLVLKSYSGMIGQAQNLLLMYIFCIPLGNFIRSKTGSRFYGAVCTAFLFQTLMITSAALISLF